MNHFYRNTLAAAGVALFAANAHANLDLTLLNSIDVTSFIGNGIAPSAVAWDGTDAYFATYNSPAVPGTNATTGIYKIANARTQSVAGAMFGGLNTPDSRGFTGLALDPTSAVLSASWDNGSGSGDSFRGFSTTNTANPLWRIGDATSVNNSTFRGIGGAAYNPGFNGGAGKGLTFLALNSGFARSLDPTTGAVIANININTTAGGTTWRDIAFDPTTGDVYARESNRLVKGVRTGAATVTSPTTFIGGLTQATNFDNQNLAFLNFAGGPNKIILNDRQSTGTATFFNTVKVFNTDGTADTLTVNGINIADGNGAYDFSFNAASSTLAISDFSNRRIYIFAAAAPESGTLPLSLAGLALGGLLVARRRKASA